MKHALRPYLRSRAIGQSLLELLGVALLAWPLAGLAAALPKVGSRPDLEVPMLLLVPLGAAFVVGVRLAGPCTELEEVASLPLPRLRLSHLLLLTLWAALLLSLTLGMQAVSLLVVLRNLIGFVGLTTLGAWLFGSAFSWLPALLFTLAVALAGTTEQGGLAFWQWWAWPMQPADHRLGLCLALALFVLGTLLFAWRGSRLALLPTE